MRCRADDEWSQEEIEDGVVGTASFSLECDGVVVGGAHNIMLPCWLVILALGLVL